MALQTDQEGLIVSFMCKTSGYPLRKCRSVVDSLNALAGSVFFVPNCCAMVIIEVRYDVKSDN